MSEYNDGWAFAGQLSAALIKVRPLGGSELFVRRNGQYYADPVYCGEAIERDAKRCHEAMVKSIRLEKHNAALVKALEAAREYLESDVADGFRPAERLTAEIDQVLGDVGGSGK